MQWLRKLREVEWIASLISMVMDIYKGPRAKFASIGGAIMSQLVDFITNIPDWLEMVIVGVMLFVAFTKYEHWSKSRGKTESRGQESDTRPVGSDEEKKGELLRKQLETQKIASNVFERQCGQYKRQAEDSEKKLSDCWSTKEAMHKDYGKAVLWIKGRTWKSRELSVAVQHVRVEDTKLAKQIRGLLAVHLQGDSYSKENHTVEHILLPFENPSCTRVVLFSDSKVGIEVQDAFNRYQLINEKMSLFEKGFASGKVPEVDIAIVVFPDD